MSYATQEPLNIHAKVNVGHLLHVNPTNFRSASFRLMDLTNPFVFTNARQINPPAKITLRHQSVKIQVEHGNGYVRSIPVAKKRRTSIPSVKLLLTKQVGLGTRITMSLPMEVLLGNTPCGTV